MSTREVCVVYIFTNGMVAVFDESGEQIQELQGTLAEAAEKISARLTDDTEIYFSQWRGAKIMLAGNAKDDLRESFDRLWKKP